ncbi:MAG: hypothetical protein ACYSUK_06485 [Planctomycetota bacterium]|jgi:hypothetical protein
MKDSKKAVKNLLAIMVFLLTIAGLVGVCPAAENALLGSVPNDCLFCVRINNLQATLNQADQFMMSSGGMMGSPTMIVRMSLAGILGEPMLNGVDMDGNFGVFGVSKGADDLFVAFLIPVTNYEQIISGKNNYQAPDSNKITKITTASMTGQASVTLMAQIGGFAVVTKENNYEQLVSLTKTAASQGGLLSVLESDEAKRAEEGPIWAYGNMEQVAKVFGPVIKEGMEEAKTQMPPEMGNFSGVMDVYLELFDMLLNEVKYISGTIKPEAEALRIHKIVQTVEGTELARLLTASESADKENKLLGYLEDGAVVSFGAKNHEGLMNKMSEIGMGFVDAVMSSEMPAESKEKMETVMQDWFKAVGQDVVFSWLVPKGTSAFNFTYVLDVADKEAFNRIIDDGMSIYDDMGIWDMYEEMGIKAGYEVQRGVDTYKGVTIDAAKFTMEATDVNSPEAQMITQMYKGGFIYRWAIVKDIWVCAIGEDVDAKVRELIDSALGESAKPMGDEIQGALSLIDGAEKADFVGTVNYIRMLNVVTKMMPFPLPAMDIPTKSNMVFAGNIGSGQLSVDVVMPKEHMQEIMMLQQMMMQQMMMQQQMQQPMQQQQPAEQPTQEPKAVE